MSDKEDCTPYGPEWEKEVMKATKFYIVSWYRDACISREAAVNERDALKKEVEKLKEAVQYYIKDSDEARNVLKGVQIENSKWAFELDRAKADRDKSEKDNERLREALKGLIGMAEDGYASHKRNGSHQEFLNEDHEALALAEAALKYKSS